MRDPQLYNFIEASHLNEIERRTAIAAMEQAEEFGNALLWIMDGIARLYTASSRARVEPNRKHVDAHI